MSFSQWLLPWDLTDAGLPKFRDGEFEVRSETRGVKIYYGENKVHDKGGLIVTTHRLLWRGPGTKRLALELRDITKIQGKRGGLFSSDKIIVYLKGRMWTPAPGQRAQPIRPPNPGYLMYSFADGGKQEVEEVFQNALEQRAWTKVQIQPKQPATRAAGIRGIIQRQHQKQQAETEIVSSAFDDLNSLMKEARAMVQIASSLKNKQDAQDHADEYDNLLGNLGIVSPVTKEAAGKKYHQLLARQLCDFIVSSLESGGGMMTLIDIYCLYNRARGTELVSPDDFKQACRSMERLGLPVVMRKLPGGSLVLQTKKSQNFGERIVALLESAEFLDERLLSQQLSISVKLAGNNLRQCEHQGILCRDSAPGSTTRYYRNFFMDFEPTLITA